MLTTHPSILHRVNMQNDDQLISYFEKPSKKDLGRLGKVIMHAGKYYNKHDYDDLFAVYDKLKNNKASIMHKQQYMQFDNKYTYKVIDLTDGIDEILMIGGYNDNFSNDKCDNFTYLLALKEGLQDNDSKITTITMTYKQASRELIDEFDNIELVHGFTE